MNARKTGPSPRWATLLRIVWILVMEARERRRTPALDRAEELTLELMREARMKP